MFCPRCGAILIPKKGRTKTKIVCSSCNFVETKRSSLILKEKVNISDKPYVEVIDKKIETLPKTKEECPKCGHKEAYFWSVLTRAGDEAETRFFKCTKCSHTWRG